MTPDAQGRSSGFFAFMAGSVLGAALQLQQAALWGAAIYAALLAFAAVCLLLLRTPAESRGELAKVSLPSETHGKLAASVSTHQLLNLLGAQLGLGVAAGNCVKRQPIRVLTGSCAGLQ